MPQSATASINGEMPKGRTELSRTELDRGLVDKRTEDWVLRSQMQRQIPPNIPDGSFIYYSPVDDD